MQVEKKRYYSLFKLAGFNGFDGKSLLLLIVDVPPAVVYVRCHRMPVATSCLPSVAVVKLLTAPPNSMPLAQFTPLRC